MWRFVTIGCAQLGPIARTERRPQVVRRLIALIRRAHGMGCDVIAYLELALTTFCPRWVPADLQFRRPPAAGVLPPHVERTGAIPPPE